MAPAVDVAAVRGRVEVTRSRQRDGARVVDLGSRPGHIAQGDGGSGVAWLGA